LPPFWCPRFGRSTYADGASHALPNRRGGRSAIGPSSA